ncbi:hypothetical protein NA57DRAFT_55593 [Rhizodiscina lignyota]|uniref:Uncharacterized protein n=1 Tax=Rhizodiscina lignyota TaxID=1504668 RepID=A0A9P4M6E3_9PEZI|nr:hypothetical protein NA57DRAFT_55593 [Rhizodiscina lignyota]
MPRAWALVVAKATTPSPGRSRSSLYSMTRVTEAILRWRHDGHQPSLRQGDFKAGSDVVRPGDVALPHWEGHLDLAEVAYLRHADRVEEHLQHDECVLAGETEGVDVVEGLDGLRPVLAQNQSRLQEGRGYWADALVHASLSALPNALDRLVHAVLAGVGDEIVVVVSLWVTRMEPVDAEHEAVVGTHCVAVDAVRPLRREAMVFTCAGVLPCDGVLTGAAVVLPCDGVLTGAVVVLPWDGV